MDRKAPLFSVVIPCYNSAPYIVETLKSLQDQVFRDFEVIVVDDNSTDHSFDLAMDALKNYGLRGVVLKKPDTMKRGVSSARNYGASRSNGEWIAFLDSDDLFHAQKLETVMQYIGNHPEIEFFSHPVMTIGENDKVEIHASIQESDRPVQTEDIYDANSIATSSVVIRKKVFDKTGFDEQLNGVEDYHLWLRIISIGTFLNISKVLGFYRERQSSLMGGRKLSHYVNQNTRFIKRLDFLTESEFNRVEKYMIYKLLSHYANVSISHHGYFSLVQGLWILFCRGYPLYALNLLFTKTTNHLLFKFFGKH